MIEQCSHGSPFLFSRTLFKMIETHMNFTKTSLARHIIVKSNSASYTNLTQIFILKLFLGKKKYFILIIHLDKLVHIWTKKILEKFFDSFNKFEINKRKLVCITISLFLHQENIL